MQEEAAVLGGTSNALKELDGIFTAVSPFVDALKDQKKKRTKANNSSSKNDAAADVSRGQIADV